MSVSKCDVLGCEKPYEVGVESTEYDHRYNFCADCAEKRLDRYDDLEVVDE